MNVIDVPWRLLRWDEVRDSPSVRYRVPAGQPLPSTPASFLSIFTPTTPNTSSPPSSSPTHPSSSAPPLSPSPASSTLLSPVSPTLPLTYDAERRLRYHWCTFIHRCGRMLELPELTTCTACVYFHRFYSLLPFQLHPPSLVSAACLLLASKVEEHTRRVRDVINCAYTALHALTAGPAAAASPLPISPAYWDVKELVLRCEQAVLRALSYDLSYTHPHSYLLHCTRHLQCSAALATLAYDVLVDASHTSLALQYSPPSIAAAAVYLAADLSNEQVIGKGGGVGGGGSGGEGPGGEREWWEEFGANRMELEDICHQVMDMYELIEQERGMVAGGNHSSTGGVGAGPALNSTMSGGSRTPARSPRV